MSDILSDAREWLADAPVGDRMGRTHDSECYKRHRECLVARLVAEIARLREERDTLLESQLWGVACKPLPPGPEGDGNG